MSTVLAQRVRRWAWVCFVGANALVVAGIILGAIQARHLLWNPADRTLEALGVGASSLAVGAFVAGVLVPVRLAVGHHPWKKTAGSMLYVLGGATVLTGATLLIGHRYFIFGWFHVHDELVVRGLSISTTVGIQLAGAALVALGLVLRTRRG